MDWQENLKMLGLSKKEASVLIALQEGHSTPVSIARETGVSRTAVYAILQNIKKRGLAKSHIMNGKKSWVLAPERDIEEVFYEAKRGLLKISEGREELHGLSDSTVVVHRGKEAIKKLMDRMFSQHKNERFIGFQGDVPNIGWNKMFTTEETNRINKSIKKNHFIVESLLPTGWFENETKQLGIEWAKDFEGRTTRVNVIDAEYFAHGGQLFLFKNSIYLLALGEELIIEIHNSEIQKMLLAFFRFMQENSRVIDANALLRQLAGIKESEIR